MDFVDFWTDLMKQNEKKSWKHINCSWDIFDLSCIEDRVIIPISYLSRMAGWENTNLFTKRRDKETLHAFQCFFRRDQENGRQLQFVVRSLAPFLLDTSKKLGILD